MQFGSPSHHAYVGGSFPDTPFMQAALIFPTILRALAAQNQLSPSAIPFSIVDNYPQFLKELSPLHGYIELSALSSTKGRCSVVSKRIFLKITQKLQQTMIHFPYNIEFISTRKSVLSILVNHIFFVELKKKFTETHFVNTSCYGPK